MIEECPKDDYVHYTNAHQNTQRHLVPVLDLDVPNQYSGKRCAGEICDDRKDYAHDLACLRSTNRGVGVSNSPPSMAIPKSDLYYQYSNKTDKTRPDGRKLSFTPETCITTEPIEQEKEEWP